MWDELADRESRIPFLSSPLQTPAGVHERSKCSPALSLTAPPSTHSTLKCWILCSTPSSKTRKDFADNPVTTRYCPSGSSRSSTTSTGNTTSRVSIRMVGGAFAWAGHRVGKRPARKATDPNSETGAPQRIDISDRSPKTPRGRCKQGPSRPSDLQEGSYPDGWQSTSGAGADRRFLRSARSRRDWLPGGPPEKFRCAKSQTLQYQRLRQPAHRRQLALRPNRRHPTRSVRHRHRRRRPGRQVVIVAQVASVPSELSAVYPASIFFSR